MIVDLLTGAGMLQDLAQIVLQYIDIKIHRGEAYEMLAGTSMMIRLSDGARVHTFGGYHRYIKNGHSIPDLFHALDLGPRASLIVPPRFGGNGYYVAMHGFAGYAAHDVSRRYRVPARFPPCASHFHRVIKVTLLPYVKDQYPTNEEVEEMFNLSGKESSRLNIVCQCREFILVPDKDLKWLIPLPWSCAREQNYFRW